MSPKAKTSLHVITRHNTSFNDESYTESNKNGCELEKDLNKNLDPKWSFQEVARERERHDASIKEKLNMWIQIFHPDEKINFDDPDWKKLTRREQQRLIESTVARVFPHLTSDVANIANGSFYYGDCGRKPDERPDWLDMDKFKRGQQFARDHYFGFNYAQLLSLFMLFSFDHGLKPLIFTNKSSTPYTSFKRYLSTGKRIKHWYDDDPWEPGTEAYKDIMIVRKLHSSIRSRLENSTIEELCNGTTIKNPMCPARGICLDDLRAACPEPTKDRCLNTLANTLSKVNSGLNQGEMSSTQFGFFGLVLLYPQAFGIHNATEEDFEALCHTWRGLGYLLGIDDEFNFCRGTLSEIRQRCKDFVEIWVKPNFRRITPEWEHMLRCVIEGLQYYFPGSSYEGSFLYLTDLMEIPMPRLYNSLSYGSWFEYLYLKCLFFYVLRIPGMQGLLNKKLNKRTEAAWNFGPKQFAKLQERSNETMKKLSQNSDKIVDSYSEQDNMTNCVKYNQCIINNL